VLDLELGQDLLWVCKLGVADSIASAAAAAAAAADKEIGARGQGYEAILYQCDDDLFL
jgi:hypothetical protein